ncbi:MAG: translation initiation factor IF-2 N-terminal domain-containing protein [Myxococcales bacterium]|nr:translation initiation factor IF-2 N-terminal domain-containing protein [Myxococcales bacterium]MCB9644164.1 translation initiation factor IF-2 N-terminal domain-containing protein [Myxococcales bacterium]
MSERVRIYQIAKDLGIPSKDLLEFIQTHGYEKVQSVQKTVDSDEAEAIAKSWQDAHAPKKAKGKAAKAPAPVVEEEPVAEKAPAKKGGRKGKKAEAVVEEAPVIEEVEQAPPSKTRGRTKKAAAPVVEEVVEEVVEVEEPAEVEEVAAAEEEQVAEVVEVPAVSEEGNKEQAMLRFAVDYITRCFTFSGFPVRVALGERRPSGQEFLLYSNELVQWLNGKDSAVVKELYRQTSYLLGKSLTYRFRARASLRFLFTALNEIDISPASEQAAAAVQQAETTIPDSPALYEDASDELVSTNAYVEEVDDDETVVEVGAEEAAQPESALDPDSEEMRFARVSALLSERVQSLGKSVLVDMLNSHERRQIHTNIANAQNNQVRTFSDGEGIFRRLILSPAGTTPRYRPSNQGRR